MRILEQTATLEHHTPEPLKTIEKAVRTCYKSDDKMNENGQPNLAFLKKIIRSGHESVIEHAYATVSIITDRGVSHELVRHRLAAYSQESTRYCNYGKDRFDNEIRVIRPVYFTEWDRAYFLWEKACMEAENIYMSMLEQGANAQEARAVLPNSLKTEIIMTANFREWKHIFNLRCAQAAHPQMRALMTNLRDQFRKEFPVIFD